MTNEPRSIESLTDAMIATNARRLAQLDAREAQMKDRWMPSIIRRPAPKARRNSVPHRSIR